MFGSGFGVGMGVGAAAGGLLIWFCKDWVMSVVMGSEAFAAKLRTMADTISSAIKR
jgi:hypothetical protein